MKLPSIKSSHHLHQEPKSCQACNSKSNLEMHHVKALRKGGVNLKDNSMLAMMQRINRKQICVCRECHMKIHTGKYDGVSLKFLS